MSHFKPLHLFCIFITTFFLSPTFSQASTADDSRALKMNKVETAKAIDKRVALVIGNSEYETAPLKNPVNDAIDVANKLRRLGFEVIERSNLKTKQIGGTLRELKSKLTPGSTALVFYAGHGVQIKGDNYLPAVDADINSEEDVPNQSLSVKQILDVLEESRTRLNLIFLDACRNNPYASQSFRSLDRGLARVVVAPSGTLISYATKPGSVAKDGDGRNGLYTTKLLEQMDSVQQIELALKHVVSEVKAASQGKQEPWMEGSIEGDFCFAGCVSSIQKNKERLVLMPIHVPDEDKNLFGVIEAALVDGLSQKYEIYSGEDVAQKAQQNARTEKQTECDQDHCMQNVGMAYQAELIATANVSKKNGSYYLLLNIKTISDGQTILSKALTCNSCDIQKLLEKINHEIDWKQEVASQMSTKEVNDGPGPAIGKPFLQLVGRTLNDELYSLKNDIGRMKVIGFFWVRCIPCRSAVSELAELEIKYPNVKFITVHTTLNAPDESPETVARFIKTLKGTPSNIILTANGAVSKGLNIYGLPHMIILDANNIVLNNFSGYTKTSMQMLENELRKSVAVR